MYVFITTLETVSKITTQISELEDNIKNEQRKVQFFIVLH